MPIIRTYDPAGAFLGLAQQAGFAAGRADRLQQQRRIDAEYIAQQTEHRNRMAQIEAANRHMGDRGGGGGRQPTGDPVRDFISEEAERAQRRKLEREEARHRASLELETNAKRRGEILGALDQAYANRPRDLAYYAARDALLRNEDLDDRLLYSLGIRSGSEDVALAREQRLREGQADEDSTPRTAQERVVRQTLRQGRFEDVAALLNQREARNRDTKYGEETPFTSAALAARAQLAEFIEETGDRTKLQALRETLGEKADETTRNMIEARIRQLEQEEIEVKAPAAYEQALETFQARMVQLQRQRGQPVPVADQQRELAKIIEATARSYGLEIPAFREWYRANQAAQRAAKLAAQAAAVGGGAPGSEQPSPPVSPPGAVPARPIEATPAWMQQQADPTGGYVPGFGPQRGR